MQTASTTGLALDLNATSNQLLNRRRLALMFLIFFFAFTQYDVLAFGKVNYLLFTIPVLFMAVTTAMAVSGHMLQLPRRMRPLFWLYLLLGLWVLPATEMIPLFNYLMLGAVLLASAMLVLVVRTWPAEAAAALRFYIWINVCAILFQVLWHSATKSQIDLHNMVFPFSRHSEISELDGFGFLRFNGFQLEPGSYAANIGTATMLHFGMTRRLSLRLIAMVLLTLLITRSASALMYFGVISLTVYIAAFRARSGRTLLATPVMLGALMGLVYFSGFADYIGNRFLDQNLQQIAEQDGSTRYKLANIDRQLTADFARQLTGSGFMITDCDACGFVNSNGAGFAMVFFFGLLGVGMIAALLGFAASRSIEAVMLAAMLLLSRHSFVQPAFWIPVIFLIVDTKFMALRRIP